jgi:HlyD family secretion protein
MTRSLTKTMPIPPRHRPPARRGGAATIIVIVLVVLAVVVGGVYAMRSNGSATELSAGSDVHTVGVTDFDVVIRANGELAAASKIELRNETDQRATITYIIEEGTVVEPGTLLVRFNSEQIERELEQEIQQRDTAEGDLEAAEAALTIQENENASALRKAELELRLAKLDLQKWTEGELVTRRRELAVRIETTERDFERLKRKHEESLMLYDKEFISHDEKEQDWIRFVEAKAAFETAQLNQQVFEEYEYPQQRETKTSRVDEAIAEIERVKRRNESELKQKQLTVKNRRTQLDYRTSRVDKLEAQLAACEIEAPAAGLVVYATSINRGRRWDDEGPYQIGSEIRPRETIIVLPDTRTMIAEVKVHESLTSRIRPGQRATVVVDAVGREAFEAEVESIGVMAESGGWLDPNLREYTVRLRLLHVNGSDLKPSMRCEAQILVDEVAQAQAVPIQAVFSDRGQTFCYVYDDGYFTRQPVATGRASETWIEIKDGLSEGDAVILREPKPSEIRREEKSDSAPGAAPEQPGERSGPGRGRPAPGGGA